MRHDSQSIIKDHCRERNLNSKSVPGITCKCHTGFVLKGRCHFHCRPFGALCEFIISADMGPKLIWLTGSFGEFQERKNF